MIPYSYDHNGYEPAINQQNIEQRLVVNTSTKSNTFKNAPSAGSHGLIGTRNIKAGFPERERKKNKVIDCTQSRNGQRARMLVTCFARRDVDVASHRIICHRRIKIFGRFLSPVISAIAVRGPSFTVRNGKGTRLICWVYSS